MLFVNLPVNYEHNPWNLAQAIFKSCPNVGKNFAKSYLIAQKLDHLTCNTILEIGLMGLKRDVVILIYYMSNGLTFEILDIILQNFQGY